MESEQKQIEMLRSTKEMAILALVTILSWAFITPNTAHAVSAADWRAGNIIDDSIFYNGNDLSTQEIQNFLNSKVPTCDTWGTKSSEYGGGTRAQYGTSRGYPPPYFCLKEYSQHGKSAAQIIKEAATTYNISAKSLVVLLQKEQALVTDEWPWPSQYRSATGYGCPDTAPCDSEYYGFYNQVMKAAYQYRRYATYPEQYRYKPYQSNYIQYNPSAGCGGTNVYIENLATAGLYNYTPYQPNASALANLYGSGDGCGAYGNRNFWRLFSDWFGSTRIGIVPLDVPRWMQLSENTYKISSVGGQQVEPQLQSGRQIFFPDKFLLGSQWYLRSRWDQQNNNKDGISLASLSEIPISSITPTWYSVKTNTQKVDPIREKSYENIASMTGVQLVKSVTVNGATYYQTAWESANNRPRFIPANAVELFKFYDFINPRTMITTKDARVLNVQTGALVDTIEKGTTLYFNKRITIGGILYAQAQTSNGTMHAISINDLGEINSLPFVSMERPRWMQLDIDTQKRSLPSGTSFGPTLGSGRRIYFPDKVYVNGTWYLRTQWDKDNGNQDGIPLGELAEL